VKASTKTRMAMSIAGSQTDVFLRSYFDRFGSPSRVTRGLQELIRDGKLTRLGYGVYAKTSPSPISGKPIPKKPLENLAEQTFKALGVRVQLGSSRAKYAAGDTTQIPMALIVSIGSSRIQRKLRLGTREVIYEKDLEATS